VALSTPCGSGSNANPRLILHGWPASASRKVMLPYPVAECRYVHRLNVCESTSRCPEKTVKKLLLICALISLTSYAAVADAQTNQQLTRAQVKQELIEMEQAGYDPGGNQLDYPANLQAARERVEAEHMTQANDQEQTASAAVEGQASN
jgi:hypothetical protein